jgi:glycine cleavage system aminomethyltransferase T
LKILRVEAGIARFGQDMDDTNVVPETNLDDAVSYHQGLLRRTGNHRADKTPRPRREELTGLRFVN